MPEEPKRTDKTVDTQKQIVVPDEGGSKQDINSDKKYALPTSETEGRGTIYVQDADGAEEPKPNTIIPSLRSLAAQTNEGKMRVKDHLIKVMADQLIELAHNNVWDGYESLEASLSPAGSDGNYDWDRNTLFLYLKGEEPQHYAAAMKSIEDIPKTNPLNVKIVRKMDEDSLLIEWGPPPFTEAVGFQVGNILLTDMDR